MSSAAGLLMAGDEMCSTDSDHEPVSMFEMVRELEERICEYNIDADADSVEPDTTYEDCYADVALHSGDFFMSSWLPDGVMAADAAVAAAMEPATIVPHRVVPMVRPVPRPRLSKMSASRLETSQIAQAHHHGGSSSSSSAGSSHCTGADVQEESKNCHTADAVGDGRLLSGYRVLLGDRMHATAVAATHYRAQLEFAQKLGFSEAELVAAHAAVGPDTDTNKLLSALIRVHDADGASKVGVAERGCDATLPPSLQASYAQPPSFATSCNHAETVSSSSRRSSAEMLARSASEEAVFATFCAAADDESLRVVVVDGSNVAMSHGNKQVFSCRGIQIVVNWFRQRGHKRITVFVPQWRKETSYPMAPISDQHVLDELEQDKVLVYTPSRRLHGRRVVCYDDRYVLQLASSEDAVVVSNDNYRDLIKENPAYKRVVEERLLMYSFVADRFMPPDDPLGRHGPTLDQFLRRFPAGCIGSGPASTRHSSQLCPYGRKCTYGSKCKYAHPERSASAAGGGLGVAGRLDSHYSTAAAAAGRAASSVAAWSPAAAVSDGCYATDSAAYSTRLAEPCSRNQVARSVSSSSAGDRRRCFGIATWSQGSSVDDEDRTHSLPIEAASAAAAAGDDQWQQYASSSGAVRLRTDTDVLRECEQRLALVRGATAAAPAAAAAGTSGAAAVVQWRRRSQPLISSAAAAASALDGQSGLPSSVPAAAAASAAAAAAHSDCAWPLQPDRGYEDAACISDPGGFHFLPSATAAAAGSYDVSSGCRHSCGSSLQSCLPLSSALQRQLSYSDSHLSIGGSSSSSSDSMLLHSSTYGSGGGDLVARTSWPYGRAAYDGVNDDESAGSRLYEAQLLARQCTAGSGGGSGAASAGYRELLSGAQPWSPYYSEGYTPVLLQPQLPVGMQFPAAMLAHGPGPMSGGYGYARGRSRSALGPSSSSSSAADPSPPAGFLPRQAAQQSRGGRTASSLSSLHPPFGDDQSLRVGSRK